MIDQNLLSQISESNDIVAVVEQYLPLQKKGQNFQACCPFHEEKTPSFTVSPTKQIYKCFGCGKGGNVIQFVKEIERISFFEAAEKLALKAGIKLNSPERRDPVKRSRKNLLLTIYQLATDFYSDNLHKFGDSALRYLNDRGLSSETIVKYSIGYAPNSQNGLLNYLTKNSINKDILKESGLFTITRQGMADLFRERIIFPIHNYQGNVVAFGARVVYDHQIGGKYINSPTTPVYTKGNELYGFHSTRTEIGRKNTAIITEGYLDYLRLAECGFTNSAAILGTSLTANQINLLSRYTKTAYLLFDGDLPGKKAAIKAAGNMLMAGLTPLIVDLPLDEDADSFLKKHGKEALSLLIEKARPLVSHIHSDSSLSLSDQDKIDLLIDIVTSINDHINRELMITDVAKTFNLTTGAIYQRIKKTQRHSESPRSEENKAIGEHKFMEERSFLIYLLNGKITDESLVSEIDSGFFFLDHYKKIFESFTRNGYIIDNGIILSIMSSLEDIDRKQVEIISELLLAEIPDASLESVVTDLKLRKYRHDLQILKIIVGKDKNAILTKKRELMNKIKLISKRVINKMI